MTHIGKNCCVFDTPQGATVPGLPGNAVVVESPPWQENEPAGNAFIDGRQKRSLFKRERGQQFCQALPEKQVEIISRVKFDRQDQEREFGR